MKTCKECNKKCADNAKTCPKCGFRFPTYNWIIWLAIGVVVFIFFIYAISSSQPDYTQECIDKCVNDYCLKFEALAKQGGLTGSSAECIGSTQDKFTSECANICN